MPRTAAVRESYRCPICGFTQDMFVPAIEVLCPTIHTTTSGKRHITGRVPMLQTFPKDNQ